MLPYQFLLPRLGEKSELQQAVKHHSSDSLQILSILHLQFYSYSPALQNRHLCSVSAKRHSPQKLTNQEQASFVSL